MTLFQAVLQTVLSSFSLFVPVGEGLHSQVLSAILHWPSPSMGIQVAIWIGASAAAFLYFWNDWASMISSVLQMILTRHRPRTLDERLPLFLALATVISIGGQHLVAPSLPEWTQDVRWNAFFLILGSGVLLLCIRFSRNKKALYDWNWFDSLLAGAFQWLSFIPGGGRILGVLCASQLRHHQFDSAVRFAYLLALPALLSHLIPALGEMQWTPESVDFESTSWLTFGASLVISLITSLITIQGFTRQSRIEGWGSWMKYRIVTGLVLGGWLLIHGLQS